MMVSNHGSLTMADGGWRLWMMEDGWWLMHEVSRTMYNGYRLMHDRKLKMHTG